MKTDHDGLPPSDAIQIKEALQFAQGLADREIKNIERLHNRLVVWFGIIFGLAVGLVGLFSWIGYSNIQRAAISAARSELQDEVTKQVQEKLTKENINQIVKDQVRDLSSTTLNAAIHKELTSPPLSTSILATADNEAKRLIEEQSLPRSLTAAQSKILIDRIAETKDLDGLPISVNAIAIGAEPRDYADEIKKSVSHSKMKLVEFVSFNDAYPIEGVGIYYDKSQSDSLARQLQAALSAAGVSSRLVPSTGPSFASKEGPPTSLEVYVGLKAR